MSSPGRLHTPESRAKIGAAHNRWTQREVGILRTWYQSRDGKKLDLAGLSDVLGRNRQVLARKARTLGLTNRSRLTGRKPTAKHASPEARRQAIGEAARKRIAEKGHPRAMLGKKKSPEACKRQSEQRTGKKLNLTPEARQALSDRSSAAMATRSHDNAYSRCKHGRRPDLDNRFFRSSWEANYARYLDWLKERGQIKEWDYETTTFWFEKIRRGVRSYKPDFQVTEPNDHVHFVEVKGWMDAKSRTKIARMARYHPGVDLRVVDERAYREIERLVGRGIPNWERRAS